MRALKCCFDALLLTPTWQIDCVRFTDNVFLVHKMVQGMLKWTRYWWDMILRA